MTVILQDRCRGCGKVRSNGRWVESHARVDHLHNDPIGYVDSYCPPCLTRMTMNVIRWNAGSSAAVGGPVQTVA